MPKQIIMRLDDKSGDFKVPSTAAKGDKVLVTIAPFQGVVTENKGGKVKVAVKSIHSVSIT